MKLQHFSSAPIVWALILSIIANLSDARPICVERCGTGAKRTALIDISEFGVSNWTGDPISQLPGCQDTDRLTASLVVYDHIWLKFEPVRPPASAQCSTYFFDSQLYFDEDTNKLVSVGVLQDAESMFYNVTEGLEVFQGGLFVGEINGEDLLDAINIFDGEYGDEYDIILNSCAGKIIQVMTFLGLEYNNQTVLDWLSSELDTDFIGEMVRNSSSIQQMYPTLTVSEILGKNNTELIRHLVYWQAAREAEAYDTVLQYFQAQNAPSAPRAAPVSSSTPSRAFTAPATSTRPQVGGNVSSAARTASNLFGTITVLVAFMIALTSM